MQRPTQQNDSGESEDKEVVIPYSWTTDSPNGQQQKKKWNAIHPLNNCLYAIIDHDRMLTIVNDYRPLLKWTNMKEQSERLAMSLEIQ